MPGSPLADSSGLSLSWFAVSLPWLPLVLLWLVGHPAALSGPHNLVPTVALAHGWLLGLLAGLCFGAVYQLLPVVAGAALASRHLPRLHLPLHVIGTLVLVSGLGLANYVVAAWGGGLVLVGLSLFVVTVLITVWRARSRDAVVLAFGAAACWLLLTGAAGLILALNRRHGFLPGSPDLWLRLHAHLGLVGFFVTLIQAASFRLLPMFTLGDSLQPDRVSRSLFLTQAGLAGLVFTFVEGLGFASIACGLLILAGLLIACLEVRGVLLRRRKRLLDHGLRAFLLGGLLLMAAAVCGLLLLASAGQEGGLLEHGPLLYGVLLVTGGLLLMVGGMLLKIFPFLVWMRAYGSLVGRGPVPLASQLSSSALEQAWLELHVLGLVLLLLGIARSDTRFLAAGGLVLLAAALCLLINLGRIALHLRSSRQESSGRAGEPAGLR